MHQSEKQNADGGQALLTVDYLPGKRIFGLANYGTEEVGGVLALYKLFQVVEEALALGLRPGVFALVNGDNDSLV
ncbi:hypothetical protein M3B29_05365 [Corynebacterium glucuronolyticum]|nr:hypothetical protein [Corynebacterium glucuronolyticum]